MRCPFMRFRARLGIMITAMVFTGTLYAFFGDQIKAKIQNLWVELSPEQAASDHIPLPSFAPMVKRIEPAILVITTEAVVKQERQQLPPELENSPFRDFFPFFQQQGPQEYKTKGQ